MVLSALGEAGMMKNLKASSLEVKGQIGVYRRLQEWQGWVVMGRQRWTGVGRGG